MAVQLSTVREPANSITMKACAWNPLANGDTGAPFGFPDWGDRTVQVFGTFGVGGTVLIEGSNDIGQPSNWNTLNDENGNALSLTAAGLKLINESPLWIRPHVTAGDGTTAITVQLSARRPFPIE